MHPPNVADHAIASALPVALGNGALGPLAWAAARPWAEILTHDPHARAIVASGYSDDPTMADFRAAGFQAALAKPFRLSDLAQAVNAVIRQDGSLLRTNEPES